MFLRSVLALAVLLFACLPMDASAIHVRQTLRFSGASVHNRVGSLKLKFSGCWLQPGKAASKSFVSPGVPYALVVRIVIADDHHGHHVAYETAVNGVTLGKRELETEGVGRRSQFIRVDDPAITGQKRQQITVRNTGPEPLFLESVLVVTGYEKALAAPFPPGDFILAFLVNGTNGKDPSLTRLKAVKAPPGVTLALSCEIPYAYPDQTEAHKRVDGLRDASDAIGWPVVPIPVSWWGGTPPEIWKRIDFQQICYSPTDNYDEGPALKKLLGDKWRIQYGLTVPNIWSNTPWQTFDNPELNRLRRTRLGKTMPYVVSTLGKRAIGYITENEPMYWAGGFPDAHYPVKREDLMADFNPHTVAKAAKDGVTLDPTDGLSMKERWWLYNDLHKYLINTSTWICKQVAPVPVYTEALLEDHFPMHGTDVARPAMEMAVAPGFITGVEMLWDTHMQKLLRLREWGPWGCVNREEGDGRPMADHTAMLLATYALGARMLNTYNWQGTSDQNMQDYFGSLAASVPERLVAGDGKPGAPKSWNPLTTITWEAGAPPSEPWGTCLKVRLRNVSEKGVGVTLTVKGAHDHLICAFCRKSVPAGTDGWVRLYVDSMTGAAQHQDLSFSLQGDRGLEIAMADGSRPQFQWLFNLFEERHRSEMLLQLLGVR